MLIIVSSAANRLDQISVMNIKPRRHLKGHIGKVLSCNWSNDNRHLVSSSQDGRVIVWDAFTGTKVGFFCYNCIFFERIIQYILSSGTYDYDTNYLGHVNSICSFRKFHRLWVCLLLFMILNNFKCFFSLTHSGLDNKVTVYPLTYSDDDISSKKRSVGTHTSYMSCCLFPGSDQQVSIIDLLKLN